MPDKFKFSDAVRHTQFVRTDRPVRVCHRLSNYLGCRVWFEFEKHHSDHER